MPRGLCSLPSAESYEDSEVHPGAWRLFCAHRPGRLGLRWRRARAARWHVVAGNPISTQAFNHWMYVAAKQQASPVPRPAGDRAQRSAQLHQVRGPGPGSDPVAEEHHGQADQGRLQAALHLALEPGHGLPDQAYWYQAEAHQLAHQLTPPRCRQALATAKKGQFSTAAQFQSFLTSSGQTLADVTYRITIQQIYTEAAGPALRRRSPARRSPAYYDAPQVPVRHAGDAQPADRADQVGRSGRGGQEGA